MEIDNIKFLLSSTSKSKGRGFFKLPKELKEIRKDRIRERKAKKVN